MSLKKEVLEDVSFFFEQYKKAAFLHIMNLDFEKSPRTLVTSVMS